MNHVRRIKRSVPTFMCFLAPLVLVKLASTIVAGAGPLNATASEMNPAFDDPQSSQPVAARRDAPSAESLAAAKRAHAVRRNADVRNPFYYEPTGPTEPAFAEVVEEEEPLDVELQAIMAASRGNTALIDGQPYRVGDVLPDGEWEVVSITSENRSVLLRSVEDGEERRLVVKTPGD